MTCDNKNVYNHIDAKGSITQVITESVNNPIKLTLEGSGAFAAKVMVSNIEINNGSLSERCARFMNRLHTFDLSEHKGECSVTVVIYNLTSNEIKINSYLESEGQMHIESLGYNE